MLHNVATLEGKNLKKIILNPIALFWFIQTAVRTGAINRELLVADPQTHIPLDSSGHGLSNGGLSLKKHGHQATGKSPGQPSTVGLVK